MTKKFLILFLINLLFTAFVFADKEEPLPEIENIKQMLLEIANTKTDDKKNEINAELIEYFNDFLETEESFYANYDSIENIIVLDSDDKKLRVLTWNIFYSDGSFKYFGFLQYKNKKDILVYFLNDKKYKNTDPERLYLSPSDWYGAIYYDIVTTKWNSRTYYTLVGWDGANFLINRKVIEVLVFKRNGLATFGKRGFKINKVNVGRLIFEYSEKASMMVRYNPKHNILVMDHLSPSNEIYTGLHQYYGPDFSYDALTFKNGKWHLLDNIDPQKAINYKKNSRINALKRKGFSKGF